jgi:predicted ATPase
MAAQQRLTLSVKNFGPIRKGAFEVKPLTVFIGPNNSGKSYMALLLYALSKALAGRIGRHVYPSFFRVERPKDLERYSSELQAWLRPAFHPEAGERKALPFKDLPRNIQEIFRTQLEKSFTLLEKDVYESIRDYFSCEDLKSLIRMGQPQTSLAVVLNDWNSETPFLSLQIEPGENSPKLRWNLPDMRSFRIPLGQIARRFPLRAEVEQGWHWLLMGLLQEAIWMELLKANGFPEQETYYLPASRSGILQGWQVFASMAVQIVRRRLGLERIEVPPFVGVAGDFLQILWERLLSHPRQAQPQKMRPALEILEGDVFHGEVAIERASAERPLIQYRSGALQLPLQRVSSMVGELTPLDLWIKYLLRPGDLLIIDEPEAHLHPENQRRIARVLVRLVRAGVQVLCTTHSSLILHQLSNHLLASDATAKARGRLGFTNDDLLRCEEVGVSLFEVQADGVHIKPVTIEPGFGIFEDEFVRVGDAIGEETYFLSRTTRRRRTPKKAI